jgi:hypothetical protein
MTRKPARRPAMGERVPPTPPVELEAERALLGAFLLDGTLVGPYVETLSPEAFHKHACRLVWRAMQALHRAGQGIDTITVRAELRGRDVFADVGSDTFLAVLQEEGTVATQVPAYVRLLRDAATRRDLLAFGRHLIDSACNGQPVAGLLDAMRRFAPLDAEPADAPHWPLHDVSAPWDFPPVTALIDDLLPAKGIVWWGGLPKRYKSLFAMYVALALACRRSEVAKKFLVHAFPKIVYIAREDGGSRLQARRDDILSAWTERPEPGAIVFCIRPRLDLLDPAHIDWLRETCLKLGATMVWLDTWTALSPSADPLGAKDQAHLAAVVVKLCEDIGGLVIVVDHSRKNRPEGQPLSSADIFGPPQKWAAAEHIVMLDVVDAGRRLEVFIEGKDLETRRFFLTVTPRGSGAEKFAYAGSAEELADAQRQVGDRNRQAVLDTLRANPAGLRTGDLVTALTAAGTTLSQDTVTRHCKALVKDKLARQIGTNKETKFVVIVPPPYPPCADEDGATA